MKGIRPILFLLVTVMLVGLSTPVTMANATELTAAGDPPDAVSTSEEPMAAAGGGDSEPNEGDPTNLGDGNGIDESSEHNGHFDGISIGEFLLHLMSQMKLLVL